ncbi:hypothetical protein C806_04029 [Lachnospiraceae bacterium 3-1]|nr:hypothetical protein C806_04029 [Lachnospiraceae bacterium 3-1]
MAKNKIHVNEEQIREQLSGRFRQQRKKLDYTQSYVASLLDVSKSAYQRLEKGQCLGGIFNILAASQALELSTADIIKALDLPPLDVGEAAAVCKDKKACEGIAEEGIYLYMRENCAGINDVTLEKLLDVLTAERLERRQHKGGR